MKFLLTRLKHESCVEKESGSELTLASVFDLWRRSMMFSVFSLILYLCQSETSFNGDVRGEGSVQRKGKARSARRLVHLC